MNLEHINLTVSDIDRSIAFYCELLDLRVRWKTPLDSERRSVHIGDDHAYLALLEATGDGAVELDYARPGVNHFGFVVEDLDKARRRLDRLGVGVHMEDNYEPGRRIYFLDPDGNEVELVEY